MATQEAVAVDAWSTVRRYIDAFNEGDMKGMAAAFAVPGSILDGMAPHVWHGETAAEDWYRDVLLHINEDGASDFFVTLGRPLHMDVTGDAAYVVVPATMTFKVDGKEITQSGAVFTIALRRRIDGWRIAAWAWAKGTVQPSI
jgi:ketosteroid isomerase-like protein